MAFNQGHPTAGTYITTHAVTKPTHDGILIGALAYETDTGDTYIYDGATWSLYTGASGGSGDIVGPAAAVANAIALFDGTTGKLLKDSTVVLATGMGAALATALNGSGALVGTTGAVMIGPALGAATYTSFSGGAITATGLIKAGNSLQFNSTVNSSFPFANTFYTDGTASQLGFIVANGIGTFAASAGPYYLALGNTYNGFSSTYRGTQIFAAGNPSAPAGNEGALIFRTGADVNRVFITNGGQVGIGMSSPTSVLHIAPTANATAGSTFYLFDNTSSTGWTRAQFRAGVVAGNILEGLANDGTTINWSVTGAGVATFGGGGAVLNTLGMYVAAGGYVYWNGRASLASPADSVLQLTNNAGSNFDRLQFGGSTSSFPALKRSTTTLQSRLADDSAYADFSAARLIANDVVRFKGYTVATLPTGTVGDNAYVTDALAPAFLSTVVGGGAIVTPVFYNGSAWVGA